MSHQNRSETVVVPAVLYRPFGLLAELTYRCPLHCPYCSNPTQLAMEDRELTTDEWRRVITEASALGVLHILFSGGEPLLRKDLLELVVSAREAGLYTNLITSALGLTRARALALRDAGLDSVQISFQADDAELADLIAGTSGAHRRKLVVARLVRELGFPLTINAVLHRGNLSSLAGLIALAEELDAQRLELAHTQYLGWAFDNQAALLPTRAQVEEATRIATEARKRLRGKIEVLYIAPDYYGTRPKPCLHGWGRRFLTVDPYGAVLPCQTARVIPSLCFENVRQHPLSEIWHASAAFNRFRGTNWMPEPCQSCPQREQDFGGCRCQAYLLTGDAEQTDPACSLSPHRGTLEEIVERAQEEVPAAGQRRFPVVYRTNPRREPGLPSIPFRVVQ
jgi:pyrroloquinoline quinone biosynthesis protein E